jgi:hypothetical protein
MTPIEVCDHVAHIELAAREIADLSPEERSQLVARIVEFLRVAELPQTDARVRRLVAELAAAQTEAPIRLQQLLRRLHAILTEDLIGYEEPVLTHEP